MYRDFLARSAHLSWPILSLVLFFIIFCLVVVYVFVGLRGPRAVAALAAMPLDDDTEIEVRDAALAGTRKEG